jgi:hypothetical protein
LKKTVAADNVTLCRKLQISFPDSAEMSHDLIEDVVTVGRIAENTIEIDDASVSSHHAQLTLRAQRVRFQGSRIDQWQPS